MEIEYIAFSPQGNAGVFDTCIICVLRRNLQLQVQKPYWSLNAVWDWMNPIHEFKTCCLDTFRRVLDFFIILQYLKLLLEFAQALRLLWNSDIACLAHKYHFEIVAEGVEEHHKADAKPTEFSRESYGTLKTNKYYNYIQFVDYSLLHQAQDILLSLSGYYSHCWISV